jgi:hypothetical protein
MTSLINIGLACHNGGKVNPEHALAVLRTVGGVSPLRSAVRVSDTEPTLVVEARGAPTATAAYEVSKRLHQDAIAVFDGREGHLYGPNAAAWGDFNPAFFVNLDGSRLAQPLAA